MRWASPRHCHGATEPVQGVHHDHVTGAGVLEHRAQPRPVGGCAGLRIQIDPLGRDAQTAVSASIWSSRSCFAVDTRA